MTAINDERRAHLDLANESRRRVTEFKRHLVRLEQEQGRVQAKARAAQVLRDEPALIESMQVHAFLVAVPGFGAQKMRRVCQSLPVWPFRTISDLTDRERRRIAEALERSWS